MDRTAEQENLREHFLVALVEATLPLQQGREDREVTLELLIEAADHLKARLQRELEELREEMAS